VAEDQSVFAVGDFKQVIHADEVPVQVHLVDPGAIVIPNDQSLLPPQSFQYRFGIGATEEHISHDIHRIRTTHSVIPFPDHRLIHFLYCGKRTIT
jgi:hypothetical protein